MESRLQPLRVLIHAPTAGVLLYISHTRDVLVGGSVLFAMAAGMSIPLLLVGASAGAVTGGRDALAPLAYLTGAPAHATEFTRIRTVDELDAVLAALQQACDARFLC
jgi:hypothetical protein